MTVFAPTVQEIPGLADIRPIGSGGMSEVYRARRTADDKLVAVKVLKGGEDGANADYAARFERECRTAKKLRHPHLVAAYETGYLDGRPYLIMEYVEGMSADKLVHLEGPMPCSKALAIIESIAEALAYMHERNYVHRDVKPSNILIAKNGTIKLSDFGLAKTNDDPSVTLAGGLLGTPHYLAPEQISSQRPVDRRSDIYSLGNTLYFLVVGEPPFKGKSIAAVLTRQLTDKIRFPDEWCGADHDRLMRFIAHMTAKSPEQRYQSMSDVLADLPWVRGEAEAPAANGVFQEDGFAPGKAHAASGLAEKIAGELHLPNQPDRVLSLAPGDVLFYEDDVADHVFWLVSGRMEVLRGGRRVAVISQAKKVLGEMALIKGTLRSATVRAQTSCEVLQIPTTELTQFLSRHPQIMHAILADMAERIELTGNRLVRSEEDLETLRQTLVEMAVRLDRGKMSLAEVSLLLKSLAIADETHV